MLFWSVLVAAVSSLSRAWPLSQRIALGTAASLLLSWALWLALELSRARAESRKRFI